LNVMTIARSRQLKWTAVVVIAATLTACGNKTEKKPGQALASVNGEEITVMQLNEELGRTNIAAAQQEIARKRLLEALIDRQLLEGEAAKEKLDRDPKVMQAIERAKATIIAQAYLQKRIGTPARPARAEVEQYFSQNPQFFAQRKIFEMRQLVLPTAEVTDAVKAAIDASKSLEEVAVYLDQHQIKYGRAQLARSSQELPPELASKLSSMNKGQLFIIREGDRSMLMSVMEVKDAPVNMEQAAPQIEQFLMNKKNKDAADAEIKRLRASAKIEYLNAPASGAPAQPAIAVPAPTPVPPAPVVPAAKTTDTDANARGVAGLK
jgi:peptidyl-prolyl cis-trans isomerase C